MKKVTTLSIALFILSNAFCQVNPTFGIGAGTDFKYPVTTLTAGVAINNFVIEGELTPSFTRRVDAHNVMGGKVGYTIFGCITPSIGYYYDKVSSDHTQLNSWHTGYSVKAVKAITDNGGVFINAMYIDSRLIVTAGINVTF